MMPGWLRGAWTALGAAGLIVSAYAAQDAPNASAASIRFVSPREHQTVIGTSVAELAVATPAGVSVKSVDVSVDGRLLASLTAPPWRVTWDAGDTGAEHRLDARLVLSDGSEWKTSVHTSKLRIDQVEEVALVNVYAVAKDLRGNYVTDLKQNEFRLFENGRPETIDRFSNERKPLRIALVLDTSLSMHGDKIARAKEAALEFLTLLEPGDQGLVITFSDRVRVLQEMTGDVEKLRAGVRGAEALGGTALYDAVWRASELLGPQDGRRVLVLLSDGKDEAQSGLEPGSLHTAAEAVDRALREEVMVFSIGLGADIARDAKKLDENPTATAEEMDFYGREPLVTILRRFSDTTGGRATFSPSAGRLRRAFLDIAEDLRHQYSLAYSSDDKKHDGTWREIRLAATRPGVAVTNRKGYFAPKDGSK